jgi:hypothetical protein
LKAEVGKAGLFVSKQALQWTQEACPAMPTRRHFISAITAALGGSVFATDGKPKTIVL